MSHCAAQKKRSKQNRRQTEKMYFVNAEIAQIEQSFLYSKRRARKIGPSSWLSQSPPPRPAPTSCPTAADFSWWSARRTRAVATTTSCYGSLSELIRCDADAGLSSPIQQHEIRRWRTWFSHRSSGVVQRCLVVFSSASAIATSEQQTFPPTTTRTTASKCATAFYTFDFGNNVECECSITSCRCD